MNRRERRAAERFRITEARAKERSEDRTDGISAHPLTPRFGSKTRRGGNIR